MEKTTTRLCKCKRIRYRALEKIIEISLSICLGKEKRHG